MGSTFPAISEIIATSTANVTSLATYLVLPIVGLTFAVTVVIVATAFVRKWVLKGVRGAAGVGGKRGRGKRR